MSTSFPFLKIANEHGLLYGDVIRHAQWFDQKRAAHLIGAPISDPPPLFDENAVASIEIILAVLDEHERRVVVLA